MRIRIVGTSDSAAAVRGMLTQDPSVVVCDVGYLYTVEIIDTQHQYPTVDGVDSEWERRFVNRISSVAETDVLLLRAAGILTDDRMRIGVPVSMEPHLIERGIFQAILQMATVPRSFQAPSSTPIASHSSDNEALREIISILKELRPQAKPDAPIGFIEKVKAWFA